MSCLTTIMGVCIVTAHLTHLDVSNKDALISSAKSYDGIERDVSRFYKPEEKIVSIGGNIYTRDTKFSIGYNNGIDTMKYDKEDSLSIQVTKVIPISERLRMNISGGTIIGGNESHKSCKDSYNREYYCGNLTAWKDFKYEENNDIYNIGISIKYKF